MARSLVTVTLLLLACLLAVQAAMQSIGARGRIMCGDKPDAGTKVKLWNKKFGPDSKLATVKTDANGNFQLTGANSAIFTMDVHLKIYTDCNRWLPCQRKIDFKIPKSYISQSSTPQKFYEMGTLNVEAKFKDESSSCLNK